MTRSHNEGKRRETKPEVDAYLQQLSDSLKSGCAEVRFQKTRNVDDQRNERFTNRFTVGDLFPDEDPVDALKRELLTLTAENYIETVKDTKFPHKSEMRVFGKKYSADVYIKIRIELMRPDKKGDVHSLFVMSFHYAEFPFSAANFPYRKNG